MNLQRSTFLVLHIVFMLNRSLISCYVEKKAAMFPAKKGIELCILNSSLAFCLFSVLYSIGHHTTSTTLPQTEQREVL